VLALAVSGKLRASGSQYKRLDVGRDSVTIMPIMNICVIGTGYVGLVGGACLADRGHKVTCVDIDTDKIARLLKGELPIFEPGLDEIVARNMKEGRLICTTSYKEGAKDAEIFFITVGTPPKENGEADLQYVYKVAEQIGQHMNGYAVVVGKSTVPVGTNRRVKEIIAEQYSGEFDIASNPEFLREGSAVDDFMNPDRIVVGVEADRAKKEMEKVYESFECPKLFLDIESAEMVKYASNAFLATKISFINEIANVCEQVGASVDNVAKGMGLDARIGPHFLQAGIGYGGSCFPKDVRALAQTAGTNGYDFKLLRSVIDVNQHQQLHFLERMRKQLGGFASKTIGVWGLAFKPNTDDIRESVALEMIEQIIKEGGLVQAYDPRAIENVKKEAPQVTCVDSAQCAAHGADALLIATQWDEFNIVDLSQVKANMRGDIIFDGRNMLDPDFVRKQGFIYFSIGR
jgi:UDPglucose 6-dehydrogenase